MLLIQQAFLANSGEFSSAIYDQINKLEFRLPRIFLDGIVIFHRYFYKSKPPAFIFISTSAFLCWNLALGMFRCLLFFTFALFYQESFARLNISIYYESKCNFSRQFIQEKLKPIYNKIKSDVNIKYVPFGVSEVSEKNELRFR